MSRPSGSEGALDNSLGSKRGERVELADHVEPPFILAHLALLHLLSDIASFSPPGDDPSEAQNHCNKGRA
jgi:hypothetical protein